MDSISDWITKYEAKAEKFILLPGFSIYYEPDKGFFCWAIFDNTLEIDHACTNDYKWLLSKLNEMAKSHGCIKLRTQTLHDPAAFMRLFKGQLNIALSGIRPNGKFYWVFEKQVKEVL